MPDHQASGRAEIIDVRRHARAFGRLWRATRLIYLASAGALVTLYVVTAYPTDYEVTPWALLMQPIVLGSMVLGWLATGSVRLALAILPLIFLATAGATLLCGRVLSNMLHAPELIDEWSRRFPDRQWDTALRGGLGDQGPWLFFLVLVTVAAVVLLGGLLAGVGLRRWRLPGSSLSLTQQDVDTRIAIAAAGGAQGWSARVATGLRMRVLPAGLAAAIGLSPLVVLGVPLQMPSTGWDVTQVVPQLMAWLIGSLSVHWWAYGVSVPLAVLTGRLARAGMTPEATSVVSSSPRPPVLLLRSFADDAAAVAANEVWRRGLHPKRLEEVAADTLARLGPFIGVADPDEVAAGFWRKLRLRARNLGTSRAVFSGDDWRWWVLCWIGSARLIVVVAGSTEGVRWELEQIRAKGRLTRTVVLLPPGSEQDLTARWQHVRDLLGGTPWSEALAATEPSRVLALHFRENGSIGVVSARRRRQRDYDVALRVALHRVLMAHA